MTKKWLPNAALAAALIFGGAACQNVSSADATCDELQAVLASCYPDLPPDAVCTEETLERYSPEDFESLDCNQIDDAGKADLFSFGGCEPGEHVCGWVFCCEDDYEMHWSPSANDWDFVSYVDAYQSATPAWALEELDGAGYDELMGAVSVTFDQQVDDGLGAGPRDLAVEITTGVIPVDFESFLDDFTPSDWGVNLDHYLGGEVQVSERDDLGRVVRQAERMVLSPFPCDAESPVSNQDMTKVEEIIYEQDRVTVYWRVMYSDNGSTETDIGTVSFERAGPAGTRVTFHSAHRLRTAIGTMIPNSLVRFTLGNFFSDHVRYYRYLVVGYR